MFSTFPTPMDLWQQRVGLRNGMTLWLHGNGQGGELGHSVNIRNVGGSRCCGGNQMDGGKGESDDAYNRVSIRIETTFVYID